MKKMSFWAKKKKKDTKRACILKHNCKCWGRHCVIVYVGFFPYPLLVSFPFSVLRPIPDLYADIRDFYAE